MKSEIDDLAEVINTFGKWMEEAVKEIQESWNRLSNEIKKDVNCYVQAIDEAKRITILEERKKYCKNYLELKQINRELNVLKFKKRRKRK